MRAKLVLLSVLLGICSLACHSARSADFDSFLQPLLMSKCNKCHGPREAKAQINFQLITSEEKLLAQPELIQRVIESVDANIMPPEDEPQLDAKDRDRLLTQLKNLLQQSAKKSAPSRNQLHRLNRFQYNNAVRDLFQLNRDLFPLPEKLLTRQDRYVPSPNGKMPDKVNVVSQALNPQPGLDGVFAFPKDLRAEHGFDNQANKLTLSPLLLDAFLRLSVSIVESPDFNAKNVGIWNEFFQEPAKGSNLKREIEQRLRRFLRLAFRGAVDNETLGRYVSYTTNKIDQGMSFTDSMKKVAAAALCSPMFLYQSAPAEQTTSQLALASRLSFFLWASIPDEPLLDLAERGELAKPDVLQKTFDRMMADRKIERFLDVFPTQWLQLENVLAVTPDPAKNRYFTLDENYPASVQMLVEPLLLFDAVFIENRPITDFIAPTFSYRSEFLRDWYESDLRPPQLDNNQVLKKNLELEEQRKNAEAAVATAEAELNEIARPARERLLEERKQKFGNNAALDLKPYAAWEFDGDLRESIRSLDLTAHGKVRFENGMVVLDRAHLLSKPLQNDLRAKTLEVWCQLTDVKQRGGGLMGIQGPRGVFDSIVLGERKPQQWISGSNGFVRTEDFPDSTAETAVQQTVHLAMVYTEDGTTSLYRNGVPYGKPFRKGLFTFPKNESSVLFGLRHLPPGGNRFLSVAIDKARLYDRALNAEEIAASASGSNLYISEQDLVDSLIGPQKTKFIAASKKLSQAKTELANIPAAQDVTKLRQDLQQKFDDQLKAKLRSTVFQRVPNNDRRYGGVITNAAVLSMTSGPMRTQPIARGAWITEVIFNDPPPPPPNNVPPLKEEDLAHLTIREQFAAHRENPSCAGCHARIDPLGFALENFDITGRWRDKYENGKPVDASGTLLRKYPFTDAVDFKASLLKEPHRVARAFTSHLLRFALSRELTPADSLAIDAILSKTSAEDFPLRSLIREVVHSSNFVQHE